MKQNGYFGFVKVSYRGMLMMVFGMVLTLMLIPVQAVAQGPEYVIGEGDTLNVSVWGNKDVSLSVKVRPDGKITVPAAGDVQAAGLTANQLKLMLQTVLRDYIKNPIVTVIVEKITNNKVYVTGGGVKSGVYELTKKTTLLQLLCQVGGGGKAESGQGSQALMLENADLHKTYIIRENKKLRKDFYALFYEGDVTQDIILEINDIIFIPPPPDRNVYVVGAVNTPKSVVYREGLTVMEAILDAGGFTKFAKESSTVIHRKKGSEDITIRVRIDDLIDDGDLIQNIPLMPGDYVVVREGLF